MGVRLRHGGSTGACRTTIRGRYGATVLSSMYRGCCCCDLVDESRPTTSGGGCGNQGYTVLYQYTFTAACSRALSLSLSLWTLVWAPRCPCAHANEGPVCSELRVRYVCV